MSRYKVTDKQWQMFFPYLARQKKHNAGCPQTVDERIIFDGILWILGTGAPWRDLPSRYGSWQTVYKWFNKWSKSGALEQVLAMLIEDAEGDFIALDSTIVKVHKHGSAPVGGQKKRVHREK